MRCQWQAFLELLPMWLRNDVDKLGNKDLQELRLRLRSAPELVTARGNFWLTREVTQEDINHCVNISSRYSPWSAETAADGYITALGGHRIGLCGRAAVHNGHMKGLQTITSLCLRVARDFPGIASKIPASSSVLIIGSPGCGKTTLLRDLIRQLSEQEKGSIAVVDERGELFPYVHGKPCFPPGRKTDVMTGCSKAQGVEMLLRTMSPNIIAVDEVTSERDCEALLRAGWCGVRLIATAHAGSKEDLSSREVYKPLVKSGIFDDLVIIKPDKTWRAERMVVCK